MKKSITKLTLLLSLATFTSCGDLLNKVVGNQNVISSEREVTENFTKIKVSNGIDLFIKQADNVSLTVVADENLQDIVITEVEEGELNIYTKKNIWKAASKKVYLTLDTLEALKASGGSRVVFENRLKAMDLELITSSGAALKIEVDTDTLMAKSSSGSNSKIEVSATHVITKTSSGASLRISGQTTSHQTSASSGSSIRGNELISKEVVAKASSGGSVRVFASESIDGKSSSGGSIRCEGNPREVLKSTSSGGSVSLKPSKKI